MAHARRGMRGLHVRRATATATEALRRIGELYAIKTQLRGQPPNWRDEIRQQATPVEHLTICDSPMASAD